MRPSASLALLVVLLVPAPPAIAAAGRSDGGVPTAADAALLGAAYPMEVAVERPPALFQFVDALAGTSPAKTVPAYLRQFAFHYGAPSPDDVEQLQRFRAWRVRALATLGPLRDGGIEIPPGAVPLAVFAAAPDVDAALARLATLMPADEVARLRAILLHFSTRHHRMWRQGRVPRAFVERVLEDPLRPRVAAFLARMARFYGVDTASMPAPRLVLVPVLGGFGTHAQALGRHLLLEIREGDELDDQAAVIVHENAHLLWAALGHERAARLEAVARAAGARGERALQLLREALPTALGQGVAEREFRRLMFSSGVPWYHLPDVDAYAKALAPLVDEALRVGALLDEDFVRRAVDALPGEVR